MQNKSKSQVTRQDFSWLVIIGSNINQVINVGIDEKSWSHASLPGRLGGLGLRQTNDVSLPTFVSSVHAMSSLLDASTFHVNGIAATNELVETETMLDELRSGTERPVVEFSIKQRPLD